MPKVSVIIPVYGVEQYIERCVDSLFKQTLDGVEYIFVDDCTPDRSIELLCAKIEEYRLRFIKENKNVQLVRMPSNSGLAVVRRIGVQLAKGDYIIHCDSDDWIDEDMLRNMYEEGISKDADVVLCDFCITDGRTHGKVVGACMSIEKQEFIENLFLNSNTNTWAVWNKLCRRSLYDNNIVYPISAMGEDMVLSFQLIWNCQRLAYVKKPLYYYFTNPDSITNTLTIDSCLRKFYQLKSNVDILIDFFSDKKLNSKMKAGILLLQYGAKSILYNVIGGKEYYDLWKSTYPEITIPLLMNSNVNIRIKLKIILTYLHLYPSRKFRII